MDALEEYVGRIERDPDLLAVILHGSVAAGKHTGSSDVDLLIILRQSSEAFLDRIPAFIDSSFPAPMDPKVYTIEEIRDEAVRQGSYVREALETGHWLYRRPGVEMPF